MNPEAPENFPESVWTTPGPGPIRPAEVLHPQPAAGPNPRFAVRDIVAMTQAALERGAVPIYVDNNGIQYIPRYDAWGNVIMNNDGQPLRTSGDINWNTPYNRGRLGRSSKKRKSRKMRKKRKSRKMRKKTGKRKSRKFRKK